MKLGGIGFELKAIELLKLCYMKELRMFHTKLFCILSLFFNSEFDAIFEF